MLTPGPEDRREARSLVVLFVLGWGRSGSSLFERMLGLVPGVASLGEVVLLWGGGGSRPCSCGRTVGECEFWVPVLEEAWGESWVERLADTGALRRRTVRNRHLLPLLLAGRRPPPEVREGQTEVGAAAGELYRAVAARTGASVVVDASKLPLDAAVVAAGSGLDVRFLHLTRDPRGVVASWKGDPEPPAPGERRLPSRPVGRSTGEWVSRNLTAELVARRSGRPYLRLGYRDLVTEPRRSLERAAGLAGVAAGEMSFLDGDQVTFADTGHTVGGNPRRPRVGTVRLVLDESWRTRLDPWERRFVTVATSPLRCRYPGS